MSADLGLALAEIAEDAARLILPYFRNATTAVQHKGDDSPVTEADQAAERLILARLAEQFPDIPAIGEEHAAEHGVPRSAAGQFFLVDPLDGTKAFVRGDEHFTVNIGLIENGAPVAGAVVTPVSGETWFTTDAGAAKRRLGEAGGQPIRARPAPERKVALVSHTLKAADESWLREKYGFAHVQRMDSSVKFCRLAEGSADLYPRHGPTMEWDTAAGDAVLRAAGGTVETLDGRPMTYGKAAAGFRNGGFLARGPA